MPPSQRSSSPPPPPSGRGGRARLHRGNPSDQLTFGLDPFVLFCAYHLGLLPDGTRRQLNLHEVARSLKVAPGAVRQALTQYGMDADAMMNLEFSVVDAQVDVQVAPPGIDPLEVARAHYQEFLDSPFTPRNWQKILAEDARENDKVFGGEGGRSSQGSTRFRSRG